MRIVKFGVVWILAGIFWALAAHAGNGHVNEQPLPELSGVKFFQSAPSPPARRSMPAASELQALPDGAHTSLTTALRRYPDSKAEIQGAADSANDGSYVPLRTGLKSLGKPLNLR